MRFAELDRKIEQQKSSNESIKKEIRSESLSDKKDNSNGGLFQYENHRRSFSY